MSQRGYSVLPTADGSSSSSSNLLQPSLSQTNLAMRNNSSRPASPSQSPQNASQVLFGHSHTSSTGSNKNESFYMTPSIENGVGTGAPGSVSGFDSGFSSKQRSSSFRKSRFSKNMKNWRWWNYMAAVFVAFALIEAAILLIGSSILYSLPDRIQIPVREFRTVPYQGLALDGSLVGRKPGKPVQQVYHVTKEFGEASMGGLGAVVTALATSQQRTRLQKVNIVMPYYSILNTLYPGQIKVGGTLTTEIRDQYNRPQEIIFTVYRLKIELLKKSTDTGTVYPVWVHLIGPGNVYPFDRAFQSKDLQGIYGSPAGLPDEWKNLYFAKAAAAFLQHQTHGTDVSLFAPAARRDVDVIHIHGATNAFVLRYLQQAINKGYLGEEPPAMIYTLHDYLDELQYSNEIKNVQKFMDRNIHSDDEEEDSYEQMEEIAPYCHGHRMFTSAMAIDLADTVTFVSKTMAKDIVEGRLDFFLKELVMGSILLRAEKNQFIGITNGVDFGKLNPWTMPELRNHELAFPSNDPSAAGPDGEEDALTAGAMSDDEEIEVAPIGVGSPNPTVRAAKQAAKKFLVNNGILTDQDLDRPLILFVGRFQYNKGLEFFDTVAKVSKELNARFFIMGQANNFPLQTVTNLERFYRNNVKVISDDKMQDQWGVYLRAAADFLLVPSLTESFGLIAAEGLLFGSTVISSGVGGLSEFLVDRPNPDDLRQQQSAQEASDTQKFMPYDEAVPIPAELAREERFNSYLFDPFGPEPRLQLTKAMQEAVLDWKRLQRQPAEHEEFLHRLISSALAMGWDRPGGPVEQYRALYEVVLSTKGTLSEQ